MPEAERQAIIDACLQITKQGLNQGTSGNVSVRVGGRMLITPSATPYDALRPAMIASMPIVPADHPEFGTWDGPLKPSSEWRFHLDILTARPEVGAIVHAHPIYCTTLAIARKPIPPVHYMIAAFGGAGIRCSDYALFGTAALSRTALTALHGRAACLLANHGAIAVGPSLPKAMWLMTELETLAHQYVNVMQIGGPVLLSDAEITEALDAFAGYGLQDQGHVPVMS